MKSSTKIYLFLIALIGGLYIMSKKFNYFKYDDFADKKSGANNMRVSTIKRFDLARELATKKAGHDVPFIVISGYRDENHPLTIESPTSSHYGNGVGKAGDITTPNLDDLKYVEYGLREAGFTRIGINEAGNTIHADDDETKVSLVTWFYDGKPTIHNKTSMYYDV